MPYLNEKEYRRMQDRLNQADDLLRAFTFWFPDKEDSRAANSPTEWARDNELLKRLKD
jgi:hypothetical protein